MSFRRRFVSMLLLTAACGDDHHTRPGWEDVSDVTLPCDIAESRCRTAIFQRVATLRDQKDAVLPPVRLITRDQYVAELNTDLGEQTEDLRYTRFSNAMGLLNLIERDQSLAEADSASSADRVLAYYDHRADDITVISDNAKDEKDGSFTLAHELTHALQDQRQDLTALDKKYATTWDATVAVDALVEGEAMWMSLRFAASTSDQDPDRSNTDGYFADWITGTVEDIASSTSPLVVAQQLLPYGFGGARVSTEWYDNGGDPAVNALFDDAGVTFARWVDGSSVTSPIKLSCQPPAKGPGGRKIEVLDFFGIPGVIALYAGLGHTGQESLDLAKGWTGDWLLIYAPEDTSTRDVAVAWRIAFATATQAQALADEASQMLGATAVAADKEVLLTLGSTEDLRDELTGAVACPAADDSARQFLARTSSPLVEQHALRSRHTQPRLRR